MPATPLYEFDPCLPVINAEKKANEPKEVKEIKCMEDKTGVIESKALSPTQCRDQQLEGKNNMPVSIDDSSPSKKRCCNTADDVENGNDNSKTMSTKDADQVVMSISIAASPVISPSSNEKTSGSGSAIQSKKRQIPQTIAISSDTYGKRRHYISDSCDVVDKPSCKLYYHDGSSEPTQCRVFDAGKDSYLVSLGLDEAEDNCCFITNVCD